MDEETIQLAEGRSQICRIFSNPTRILILWALANRELCVSEIALAVNASIQNTSHHLRLMRDKGILDHERRGQTVSYRIVDLQRVQHLLEILPEPSTV
jgi:DNA-binding transcriptional ArsR family regulator